MATPVHPDQTIVPARGDAIRIVPLYVPDVVGQPTVDAAARNISRSTAATLHQRSLAGDLL